MDDELNHHIAARFREEIIEKFEKIDMFASMIGMEPSNLRTSYLSGKSIPGGKLLLLMIKLGLNVNYILTGNKNESNELEVAKKKISELSKKIENLEAEENTYKINYYLLIKFLRPVFDILKSLNSFEKLTEIEMKEIFAENLSINAMQLLELNKYNAINEEKKSYKSSKKNSEIRK